MCVCVYLDVKAGSVRAEAKLRHGGRLQLVGVNAMRLQTQRRTN